jgi:hypothetical protein
MRLAEYHYRRACDIHPHSSVLRGCVGVVSVSLVLTLEPSFQPHYATDHGVLPISLFNLHNRFSL